MNDKKAKDEMKRAKEIAKFSRDWDMSMVIKWSFTLFAILVSSLFFMEAVERFRYQTEEQRYLTPEIVHTIFGFIGGWCSAIVMYFFAKKLGEQQNQVQKPPE